MITVDENLKAAIIGFWRMGATLIEIRLVTDLEQFQIDEIINIYKQKNNKK